MKKKKLNYIFVNFLFLLHPFCPFLTEELFGLININSSSIINNNFPAFNQNLININSELYIDFLKNVITVIRRLRKEQNINFNIKIAILLEIKNFHEFYDFILNYSYIIKFICNLSYFYLNTSKDIKNFLLFEDNSLFNLSFFFDKK